MTLQAVIFDIGGVLLDWQPHLAYAPEMGADAARDFLRRIDFSALNLRADAGAAFADLAMSLPDAADAARLAAYPALYARTLAGPIPGTWALLDRLAARGLALHAITNWSAETWPIGLAAYPRLAEVFGTIVVSGHEGTVKPDPRIFQLLCTRTGLAPDACLFIDDGLQNVVGARAVGMQAMQFTDAPALDHALVKAGLL